MLLPITIYSFVDGPEFIQHLKWRDYRYVILVPVNNVSDLTESINLLNRFGVKPFNYAGLVKQENSTFRAFIIE